jgi:hypothetical protein
LNGEDLFRRESAGHDDEEEKPEGGEIPIPFASRQISMMLIVRLHMYILSIPSIQSTGIELRWIRASFVKQFGSFISAFHMALELGSRTSL